LGLRLSKCNRLHQQYENQGKRAVFHLSISFAGTDAGHASHDVGRQICAAPSYAHYVV
jgi:hypothetical protein